MSEPTAPLPAYEVEDAQPRLIGIVAAIVASSVVASLILVAIIYHRGYREVAGQARQSPFASSAEYRTSIAAQWPQLDAETQRRLHTYQWVDRAHGVVQIPIERAMDKLVEEQSQPPK